MLLDGIDHYFRREMSGLSDSRHLQQGVLN
jgi:hypothetical protein